jgi:hypothetical protein
MSQVAGPQVMQPKEGASKTTSKTWHKTRGDLETEKCGDTIWWIWMDMGLSLFLKNQEFV